MLYHIANELGYLLSVLEEVLVPFSENNIGENMVFQQEPCYASKFTKRVSKNRNIPVLDWPAFSSDLNPIKNV